MKKTTAIVFLAAFFLFLVSSQYGYAFRCGSGLVTTGDTKTQVLLNCGQPTTKDKASCEGQQAYLMKDKAGKVKKSKKCTKKLEVWHYNCGDNDFIYALTSKTAKWLKKIPKAGGKVSRIAWGSNTGSVRLLKNAHTLKGTRLLRCAATRTTQRISIYASQSYFCVPCI